MVTEIWEIGYPVRHAKFGAGTVTELDRTCYQPNHSEDNPWVTISYNEIRMAPLMRLFPPDFESAQKRLCYQRGWDDKSLNKIQIKEIIEL